MLPLKMRTAEGNPSEAQHAPAAGKDREGDRQGLGVTQVLRTLPVTRGVAEAMAGTAPAAPLAEWPRGASSAGL